MSKIRGRDDVDRLPSGHGHPPLARHSTHGGGGDRANWTGTEGLAGGISAVGSDKEVTGDEIRSVSIQGRVREIRSQVRGVIAGVARDVDVQGEVWFSLITWVWWRRHLGVSWPGCAIFVCCFEAVKGVMWWPAALVVPWRSLGELRRA